MISPQLVAKTSWWVPADHHAVLAVPEAWGSFRVAVRNKVDNLVAAAMESSSPREVAREAENYLPGLDATDNPDSLAEAVWQHPLVQGMVRQAEEGPPATPERARDAVERQKEVGLLEFLAATPGESE